jgi:hypothetical protein
VDYLAHEAHDLPLADRLVSEAIRKWLDTGYGFAQAGNGDPPLGDYERGFGAGIEQMRYLHLDNYWYTVVPTIIDELRRAGLLCTATG